MLRKIITIDQEKCNGCGLCAQACHEQAIGMVDGKAALLRDDYCDGLGDCLPVCPTNAITFEVREAAAYDEAAVLANKASQEAELPCGCPGTQARLLHQQEPAPAQQAATPQNSELQQWPVQIKLDNEDYSRKLTEILLANDIKSVTVVRMEVPCCGGMEQAVRTALQQSGKIIPWQVVTISTDGQILEEI